MSIPEVDPTVDQSAAAPVSEAAVAVDLSDADGGVAEQTHEPTVVAEREVEVSIERSVRFGRILIGGTIIGAALASLASLFFPIAVGADYSMSQIVGFMLLIGAIIGLTLGAILTLILSAVAKRRRGSAVAIQADVR